MLFTLIILGNVNVDVQRGEGGMTAKKSLCQNLSHYVWWGGCRITGNNEENIHNMNKCCNEFIVSPVWNAVV